MSGTSISVRVGLREVYKIVKKSGEGNTGVAARLVSACGLHRFLNQLQAIDRKQTF